MLALAPPGGDTLRTCRTPHVDHAGAESNTCVGLARLGFRVAWVSRLGRDAAGDRILDALCREGVDTQWVARDPRRATGLMIKDGAAGVQYYRTGSAASVLSPETLHDVPVADARAVVVSGVTALIGPEPHAAGLELLSTARGLRIVDPNLRHGLWGSDRRAELVLHALVETTRASAISDHHAVRRVGSESVTDRSTSRSPPRPCGRTPWTRRRAPARP